MLRGIAIFDLKMLTNEPTNQPTSKRTQRIAILCGVCRPNYYYFLLSLCSCRRTGSLLIRSSDKSGRTAGAEANGTVYRLCRQTFVVWFKTV